MRKAVVLALFGLSACATMSGEPIYYPPQSVSFNPAEVAWATATGNNTVSGNAVMRTVGGDVRTCAGTEAFLVPVSAYSTERMQIMFYGATDRGYAPANELMQFPDSPPGFSESNRRTTCDSQGDFIFTDVPDGAYYVISMVTWGALQGSGYFTYTATQGGAVMQRVEVAGGQTRRVVLTN